MTLEVVLELGRITADSMATALGRQQFEEALSSFKSSNTAMREQKQQKGFCLQALQAPPGNNAVASR